MVTVNINNEIIQNIDLFVFDKDGTLIDLYNYWYHMIELRAGQICDFYKLPHEAHKVNLLFEMGVDVAKQRLRPTGPVGLLPREVVQRAAEEYLLKLNCTNVSDECFRIFKNVDQLSISIFNKLIKPIQGAIELLEKIKASGGKVAIATTDKTERAKLAVDFLNIGTLCDVIIGADKVKKSKPSPEMLEHIEKELGIAPANSVMVGDAKTDIKMGSNANYAASIAVCSGLTSKGELAKLTPYVVDDVSQIYIK